MAELPIGTVTFLFTDIEGSTRLWEQHPEAMQGALARHDALLRSTIQHHGGAVFKTIGDAFCAAFASAENALAATLLAQQTLRRQDWTIAGPLGVRMALYTGPTQEREGDYFGPSLNRVARVLAAGHGGQVLLSLASAELVRDVLPQGASLRDLGEHRLRDLSRPERIFQLLHPDLPADFPPLRSLEAFAHNLPIQLTSFIGREREIAEVKRLLGGTRLLTLTGAGGCGKTRLALRVVADLLEEFADGVWLVELAALADPALVPRTVAAALGLKEEPGRPISETLAAYLRPKRLLLLLDNCEHLIQACAELAEALLRACPKVTILATSREALGIAGERPFQVPCLSLPEASGPLPAGSDPLQLLTRSEASRLFVERAQTVAPGFEVTPQNALALAQICRRLDGIPLAIELASARVKVVSPEQIAQRLDDCFRLLTGGSRTALPRQQTLRALIDWSYHLLSEAERALLRRLSVFAGGWTLEAAEAVCSGEGVEEWEVLELLSQLVDKSLVMVEASSRGETRYRLLETVRQYSRERLLEAGETESVRARHAQWFVRLTEEAYPQFHGPEQVSWSQRLNVEHDNLRTALAWSVDRPLPTDHGRTAADTVSDGGPVAGDRMMAGLRLAGSLWWFWQLHGYFSEGQRWLQEALRRARAVRRACAGASGNDGEQAEAYGESVAPPDSHLKSALARALHGHSALAMLQGDFAAALPASEECVTLYRELGEAWELGFALRNLGWTLLFAGDEAAARRALEECLTIYADLRYKPGVARGLNVVAHLERRGQEYEKARSLWQQATTLAREAGDLWLLAHALANLGRAAEYQDDWNAARSFYEESLSLRQELGDARGIVECLEGLAAVAAALGAPERAARLFGAVEAHREALAAPAPDPREWRLDRTPLLAAVQTSLGQEVFAAAWAQGRVLPPEQATAEALTDADVHG